MKPTGGIYLKQGKAGRPGENGRGYKKIAEGCCWKDTAEYHDSQWVKYAERQNLWFNKKNYF